MRIVLSVVAWIAWVGLVFLVVRTAQPASMQAAAFGRVAGAAASPARHDDDKGGDPINGRKVFLKNNCYICHGGRGGGGMCPSLREDPDEAAEEVREVVLEGTSTGMPSFRRFVTDQEIRDLAAYLRSLRTDHEPTFTHWWEAVPSQ